MTRSEFERLVRQAINEIPEDLRRHLNNVDLVVEDKPSMAQLVGSGVEKDDLLLGLYEGLPLTERHDYGMVLPDRITLFKDIIEEVCEGRDEVVQEIRETVIHEIAHHFGIDDDRLHELGV